VREGLFLWPCLCFRNAAGAQQARSIDLDFRFESVPVRSASDTRWNLSVPEPNFLARKIKAIRIKALANRILDTEFCWLGLCPGISKGAHEISGGGRKCECLVSIGSVAMIYVLVLVILGGANAGKQSLRVGHYRSLASCEAAANEAKGIGLEKGTFGFVCVRSFGPSKVASER
jgi:hypothetical protein